MKILLGGNKTAIMGTISYIDNSKNVIWNQKLPFPILEDRPFSETAEIAFRGSVNLF